MAKIGRNDPCPCGSGKKYKNCCLKKENNVVDFQEKVIKQDLRRIQREFAGFINNYEDEISEFLTYRIEHDQLPIGDDYTEEFANLFSTWMVFNLPFLENGQTIFQDFINKHGKDFRPAAVEMAKKWVTIPGMFEVQDHLDENHFVVNEIYNDQKFTVNFEGDRLPGEGSGLIGILVPYGKEEHEFLMFFHGFDLDQLLDVFWEFQGEHPEDFVEHMRLDFPAILNRVFTVYDEEAFAVIDDLEWSNEKERMTAEMFSEMNEETLLADARIPGVLLWHRYCVEKKPRIGKEAVAAAALEYLVNQLEGNVETQKEAADRYGVSPGSVSQRFLDMEYLLYEMIDQIADMEIEGESMEPQFSGTNSRIEIEKEMRKLHKAIGDKDFDSEEELEAFFKDWNKNRQPDEPPANKKEQAQNLVDGAWQQPPAKRVRLAKQALKLYPNTPDAYVILAQESRTLTEMKDCYYVGMKVGEKELGPEYFTEDRGYFWGLLETRPYMRAKQGYAKSMWILGDFKEAIAQYREMLELNPNDNQGIRYGLLTVLLESEKYGEAEQLMDQFPEPTANMEYNRAFLQYAKNGWTTQTKKLLNKALEANPHVPDYLLGKKPIPEAMPQFIGMGDENEAIDYAQHHAHLWRKNRDLLQKLKEFVKGR